MIALMSARVWEKGINPVLGLAFGEIQNYAMQIYPRKK